MIGASPPLESLMSPEIAPDPTAADVRWVSALTARLAAFGLNAWGVADGQPYQSVLPGCRSVLVFGSGGPALWQHFVAWLRADPARLSGEQHPLDAFIQRSLEAADPAPETSRRWVRCAADETCFVDFRPLARDAGLGWSSRLGLLLHPVYGPWMGLRAACFTTEALPVTGAAPGDGPCAGCAAPCVTVCPAEAVRAEGFDIVRCAAWRAPEHEGGRGGCPTSCGARNACPEGAAWRYPDLEQHYHDNRRTGRAALGALLGVDQPGQGVGPHWGTWAKRGSP